MACKASITITENSTNVGNNTSSVTVKCYMTMDSASWIGTSKYSSTCKIDGESYSFNLTNCPSDTKKLVYTKTVSNIKHNADGTKTLKASWSTNWSGGYSASASKQLTKIPRKATINTANNFKDNVTTWSFKYDNPAGSKASTLRAGLFYNNTNTDTASASTLIGYQNLTKTTSGTFSFSITNAVKAKIWGKTPNKTSLTVYLRLHTKISGDSSTDYYSSKAIVITITNKPPNATFNYTAVWDSTTANLEIANNPLSETNNYLINRYSQISFTDATTPYDSYTQITSRSIDGVSVAKNGSVTMPFLKEYYTAKVTDSRGFTSTRTYGPFNIIEYTDPTVLLSVENVQISNNNSATFTLNIRVMFYNGSFGNEENTLTLDYRVTNGDTTAYQSESISFDSSTSLPLTLAYNITVGNYKKATTAYVTVADVLQTVTEFIKVPIAPVFDWSDKDFAFNVPVKQNDGVLTTSSNPIIGDNLDTNFNWATKYNSVHYYNTKISDTNGPDNSGILENLMGPDEKNIHQMYYSQNDGSLYHRFSKNDNTYADGWERTEAVVDKMNPKGYKDDVVWRKVLDYGNVSEFAEKIDTGWIYLTPKSPFINYSTSGDTRGRIRRVGNMVMLQGVAGLSSAVTGSATENQMYNNLGAIFRPSAKMYIVCQGSGINKWLLTVNTAGEVTFSRYGTTSYANAPAGVWLPFNVTYFVNDYFA